MKTSKINKLILIISIIFIVNIISIGTVNATQKVWDKTEAKTERIQIARYILANENQKIKSKYPNWTILTTNESSELDKNGDKKVDKNDLIKVKRHIVAMENNAKKKEHPDWIIYIEQEVLSEKVTLNKNKLTLERDKTEKLNATITPTNATNKNVTWSSSDTGVATVDSTGKVTAKKAGTATIIAKTSNEKNCKCTVTVTEPVTAVKLDKNKLTIENKKTTTLKATITPNNATNKTVTWSSSDTSVATVDSTGKVTAKKAGTATITAKTSNGKNYKCTVTVTEPVTGVKLNNNELTIENKKTATLKATITPNNATNKKVEWSSSNTSVATVDGNGRVTAKKAGTTTITAKTTNGKKASCKVTVEEPITSIKLNKSSIIIYKGDVETLKATIAPTNATNKTITWSSTNTTVATVDKNGKVTAKNTGTATIVAKTKNGKTANCKVTVKAKITTKLNGHEVTLANGDDRVYFLDVTDYKSSVNYKYDGSDAIIIESNGKYAMIDTGIDYQGSRVVRYLKDIGATNLEFILITHAHIDHYGGFETIINNGIKVKKLYIKDISNGKSDRISAYNKIVKNAKSKNIPIYNVSNSNNQHLTLGDFKFDLYNTQDRLKSKKSNVGENVNSVGALAQIHGKKIFFAADLENDPDINCYPENEVANAIGTVDVYKAAHHLYSPSNSVSILKKLNPKYGIVTNQRDRYGTVGNKRILIQNTRITDSTLFFTGNGTTILTINTGGELTFQTLPVD